MTFLKKGKPVEHRSRRKSVNKKMVKPALKVAGKDRKPVTTRVVENTEKVVMDPCISKTSTPVERQQLATAEAGAK